MLKLLSAAFIVASGTLAVIPASAQDAKPNILVIFGDDIGITNVSAYSDGLMGYITPNIDRIGDDGARFLQ
jgi:arylsulfatase